MTTTQPTKPSRADLDKLAADLCDQACAANERGDDGLEETLNRAIDAIEGLLGETLVVADAPAARGFA